VTIPAGQKRILDSIGMGFEPLTTVEVARLIYPNHTAWETMGEAGSRSWSGLVAKVSNMLGNLEVRRYVWRIGERLWCRSGKGNAGRYFEWLRVMCDVVEDNAHDLREEARNAIYWYLLHLNAKQEKQVLFDQDTVLACVRALIEHTDWQGSEQVSSSKAIYRGILVLIHQSDLDKDTFNDLRLDIARWLIHKRRGSESRERLEKIIELIERDVLHMDAEGLTPEDIERLQREFDEETRRQVEEFVREEGVVGWSTLGRIYGPRGPQETFVGDPPEEDDDGS
jgi:hypothetical protein